MEHEIKAALQEHGRSVLEFKESVSSKLDKISAELERHQSEIEDAHVKLAAGMLSGGSRSNEMKSSQLTKIFTKSDQFSAVSNGAPSTGRVQLGEISVKSLVNAGRGGETDTDYNIQAQRAPGIHGIAQQPLTLLDWLPSLPVSNSVFEYMQDDGYLNAADYQVSEGDDKSETTLPTKIMQAQVATIAHWIKASNQVLSDDAALAQQIGNLLSYGLLQKLEAEIVGGAGGQGKITGLLTHATAFAGDAALAPADRIGQAMVSLLSAGWMPRLIVMNPQDWFSIASERDSQGQYVLGGPRDTGSASLWGGAVVSTPSLQQGTALVLDPAQVAVLDRMAPTLMASRHDDKNFTTNLTTLLAELRAGLAVFAPSAVLKVDLAGGDEE